jgi:hypothetical protein
MKEIYKIKVVKSKNISHLESFQDFRVTCPDGAKKYFSSNNTALSFITVNQGVPEYE